MDKTCDACNGKFKEGGLLVKQYIFCSSVCMLQRFTLDQLKLLYKSV